MDFIKQEKWDSVYSNITFSKPRFNDQIRIFLQNYIPLRNGTCFEIGCYPGTYLSVLGEMGFQLNGIDLTPNTDTKLVEWLKSFDFNIGKIERNDFLKCTNNIKYDLVVSFGFIEHFKDYGKIILKQSEMIKKGGFIVLTTPNLNRPFLYYLHKLFNPKTLKIHNICAMEPEKWKKIIENEGFEILFCGHFGYFNFWIENESRGKFKRMLLSIFVKILPIISKILPRNNKSFSPYIGLVAKKINS